jgi:hypothetical protein
VGGSRSIIPLVRLWKRLCRLGWDHEVRSLTLEEAFAHGAAGWRLQGMQTLAMFWAHMGGVSYLRLRPNMWKAVCCGNGKLGKLEYLRLAQERWPEVRIWNDDQAAARWILLYRELMEEHDEKT